MKLEFIDGSSIDVISIYGSPRLILGVMRDTLSIEISQNGNTFEELKAIFKDGNKTSRMYIYDKKVDSFGQEVEVKTELGEGYKVFVSISDEIKEIQKTPGTISPVKVEEIYVVTISQLTYQESLLEDLTGSSESYQLTGDSDS